MRGRGSALRRRYGKAATWDETVYKKHGKIAKGDAPPKSFKSPGGRVFTLGRIESVEPRFKGDTFWSDTWPIFHKGKEVASISRNLNYGTTAAGKPRWQGSLTKLVWSGPMPPTGIGFDVSGCDTAADCLVKMGRNMDGVFDWREGKAVRGSFGVHKREV
jgi:hypothetical protein